MIVEHPLAPGVCLGDVFYHIAKGEDYVVVDFTALRAVWARPAYRNDSVIIVCEENAVLR